MNSQSRRGAMCLAAAVLAVAGAQTGAQVFQRAIGLQADERSEWIIQTNQGGYGVCGVRQGTDGDAAIYALRLDPTGATIWDTVLAGPGLDIANRIEQDPDGFIMAGETTSAPGGPFGMSLVKLGPGGNLVWSRAYVGTPFAGGTGGGTALDLTSDGGYVIAGRWQLTGQSQQSPVVYKTGPGGGVHFGRYYVDAALGQNTFASWSDIHQVRNAAGQVEYLACGFIANQSFGSRDTMVARLDSVGNVIWCFRYGQPTHTDFALGLEPAANGDILVTGFAKSIGEGGGTYLMRLAPGGNVIWYNTYRFWHSTGSMHELPSGRVVLAGNATDFAGTDAPSIMLTGAPGSVSWTRTFPLGNPDFGEAVTPTSDDGFAVAAWADQLLFGSFDLHIIKTDPDGRTGCEEDWQVDRNPEQIPIEPVVLRVFDLQENITLPLEQTVPDCRNEEVCDDGCPDCAPDLAAPIGILDFFDILAFLNLFQAHDPCADLAAPFGVWDFFDVLEFLSLFQAGCP